MVRENTPRTNLFLLILSSLSLRLTQRCYDGNLMLLDVQMTCPHLIFIPKIRATQISEESCLLDEFSSSLHDLTVQKLIDNFKNSYLHFYNSESNDFHCVRFVSTRVIILIHHMSRCVHGFGPNHDGCKTPTLGPSPQVTLVKLFPPNPEP